MSFVKIWIHLVFATKNREPWLEKELRTDVCHHIIGNCRDKNISLQTIGGYTDHLHCLLSLKNNQNIADISQLIKGESAYWINNNKIIQEYFRWQDDYFALSVGESQVQRVVNYIRNQDIHHTTKSFADETKEFNTTYGWVLTKG